VLPVSLAGRWHKINRVNTSVNAAIAPRADPDRVNIHWRIAPTDGDCNDYAVTKRHKLLSAGWPSSSLSLTEVTLLSTGEHHRILIVRGTKADWVLDNLKPNIERLAETRNEYAWDRISRQPEIFEKFLFGLELTISTVCWALIMINWSGLISSSPRGTTDFDRHQKRWRRF
jgi:predicted transglutaminase-like cysteine proteinase